MGLQACDERELPVLALSSWQQDAIWRIVTFCAEPAPTSPWVGDTYADLVLHGLQSSL